jgi:hypothetical protein
MSKNDATPAILAVACPHCGRPPRDRCKNTLGVGSLTHRARWEAAGLPMPTRPRYAGTRERNWRRR